MPTYDRVASTSTTFEARYRSALESYLEPTADETQLIAALELGRTALAEEVGLLDLLTIHHVSLESLIQVARRNADVQRLLAKASEFLTQVAAPFEMAQRGWRDIAGQLRVANEGLEQRVAERTTAYREAAERLDRAQEIAEIGSWELDLESGAQIWSREMCRICGLAGRSPEFCPNGIAPFILEEDREIYTRWLAELQAGEEPMPIEVRIWRPNGEHRVVNVDGKMIGRADRTRSKISCTVQDVTERKRADKRLRVQHTVAQILAEAATIEEVTPRILRAMGESLGWDVGSLWRVDREAEVLRCVELWHKASTEVPEFERVSREFTFVPGSGLPGRVWSSLEPEYIRDLVPDENFRRGPSAQREGLHAGFGFPIMLGGELLGVIEFFSREIRTPNQELLNLLATIGSQIGQFIERKRAETELRESEENYRALFESIDEGFCTIEVLFDQNEKPVDYRFLQISPSFERQTGIKNAVGRRMREIAPQHEEHWFEIYGRIALTGEPMRFENEAKQLGRWYDVYAFRIEDPKRRRVGILFHDITERKRAEAEARDSERRYREVQAELSHANRVATMGQLTASIAHEVNHPIAATILNAHAALRWLNRDVPDLEEVRQLLTRIANDGDRAGNVVSRIRNLVNKAPPRMEPLNLNEAISEVIELTRGEAMKNGVSVQTQFAESLPAVTGDRTQLQQVILNLILNAVQAMIETGLTLRELQISTEMSRSDGVLISVHDSGPGIHPQNLDRLFDPFYTTKSAGMGMGLAICRSIVEGHGGRIWAMVNVPRGATFCLTLPAAPE
jgi:PAS domain S-box-containing protein